jgi:RND family efflux transporter, MFP subunit
MSLSVGRRTLWVAAVTVFAGVAVIAMLPESRTQAQQTPALPTVKVQTAQSGVVSDWEEYSGRLEAIERVEIRPKVAGTLLAVHFRDGQIVRKGDLLFTIDPAPFKAELERAEALLAQARDRQRFTASEVERGRRLLPSKAISEGDFDALVIAAQESVAAVQAARAAADRARLDLDYTRIEAPISGRISRPEITAGNVVKAGGDAEPLASIVMLDPIYAAFNIDERTYVQYIASRIGDSEIKVNVGLVGDAGHPREGTLYSVDNQLHTPSGTIRMRAILDNPDGRMIPGLQAKVQVQVSDLYPAVLVNEASIATDQDRRFVLVIDPEGRVAYRPIKLGKRHGTQRVVREGLAPGEQVIVDGASRVRPGDVVRAEPAVMVAANDEERAP